MKKYIHSLFPHVPFERINWVVFSFLFGTLLLSVTAVPLYLYFFGFSWFLLIIFATFYCATGLSITFGYHRLFAHKSFEAALPVRLFCILFGAAAFENSVIDWASDHRRHHKHTDHEDDPYDISKGLWHAHMGWMLFKLFPVPPYDNVADLQKDPWIAWQHRYWLTIAITVGFVLPSLIGFAWNGWEGALAGFLFGGVLRVVCVQHSTFCINSLCHWIGSQPYSKRCSARDSWLMALVTFGEGYHNYHHEFQHDYRNGVQPWQWDPTKWLIWTLSKVGITWNLRQVPKEKIRRAMREQELKDSETDSGELTQDQLEEAAAATSTAKVEAKA